MWILEAQSYMKGEGFIHVGYVAWGFKTKKAAGEFYHRMYPDMRDINRDGKWTSDWSPIDNLRYIVRPLERESMEIVRCREVLPGQKDRLVRMNKAIRIENGKPEDS